MDTPHSGWIPNIDLGRDYDKRYLDANIHYDVLRNLAAHFGRKMPVHRHAQSVQIHFIENGPVTFQIDERLFQVTGPCLVLTPAATPHAFEVHDSARGHVITINQTLIWKFISRAGDLQLEQAANEGLCLYDAGIRVEDRADWLFVRDLINRIATEWSSDDGPKPFVLDSFVGLLLIYISRIRRSEPTSALTSSSELQIFHHFTQLIEAHYKEHWHITQYTHALGIAESKLAKVCRQISHSVPKELVQERLLREAKRLLSHTLLTSSEIAYELGFHDPAYFSRFFKAKTGLTPISYRRAN